MSRRPVIQAPPVHERDGEREDESGRQATSPALQLMQVAMSMYLQIPSTRSTAPTCSRDRPDTAL
jgi:hypothetical protein